MLSTQSLLFFLAFLSVNNAVFPPNDFSSAGAPYFSANPSTPVAPYTFGGTNISMMAPGPPNQGAIQRCRRIRPKQVPPVPPTPSEDTVLPSPPPESFAPGSTLNLPKFTPTPLGEPLVLPPQPIPPSPLLNQAEQPRVPPLVPLREISQEITPLDPSNVVRHHPAWRQAPPMARIEPILGPNEEVIGSRTVFQQGNMHEERMRRYMRGNDGRLYRVDERVKQRYERK